MAGSLRNARAWTAIAWLCLAARGLMGHPALVPGNATHGATCLGPAEVSSQPVEPSHDVVIAVFADTLRDEDLAELRRQVESFYQAAGRNNPLRR